MRRRRLLGGIGAVAAFPIAARAQQQSIKIRRVGYLSSGASVPSLLDAFREELRDLGWHEGQDIVINYQFAAGHGDALPALATALVQIAVDVIVASPTPAALAAKNATATIPIVGIGFDNPIEHGLIASLAHPGGNVTGVSYSVGPQIFGKDLELFSQMVPEIRLIAVLSNSANPNHEPMIHNVASAARSLRLEFVVADARGPVEFDAAFAKIANTRVGALFVFGDPMFSVHRERLAQLAARNRLPSMYTHRLHVQAGGLMSYGPSFSDLWRRAAVYVDKILKGAKPADLPVEQPNKYELVINLKTAKALGLTVPLSLLVRADEVIE
jgi:putative ABC transport system substrate-binding protein